MSNPRASTNPFAVVAVNDLNAASQPFVESAGGRLRDAREAQKITEKQAAQKLHLMVTDLRAIEADRYHASVHDDLLRKHLRDYANFLQLDPDSIVAIYDRQTGKSLHRGSNRIDNIPRANKKSFGSMITGALVLLTLVLGLVVLLQFSKASRVNLPSAENRDGQQAGSQQSDGSNATAAKLEDNGLLPATGADAAFASEAAGKTAVGAKGEGQAVGKLTTGLTKATQAQQIKPAATTSEQPGDGAVQEVAASLSDGGASATASSAGMKLTDELSFRFAKDCWVEVYDADEQRLIAEVRKAGGSLLLSGKSPFKVLVGHSREVVLQFNDHPVDIEKIDRSYSTLFTVGRSGNDAETPVVKTIRRKLPQ